MDTFRLQRFVDAQDPVFAVALRELRAGQKRTHWMWFVFPQLRGLGFSSTAQFYGLSSVDEAKAYLAHAALGKGLKLCTRAVFGHQDKSLTSIFGSPDDMKFRSSMTLFAHAAPQEPIFREALNRMCGGIEDQKTLSLLEL